jgi:coenzyme Q-binding protein COQ10
MAAITKEITIDVAIERFFDLLVDYQRYPEFVPNLIQCRVIPAEKYKDVEYQLDLGIRRIRYTLRHLEERPVRIRWSLVGGDLMKVSNGSWELDDLGGRTRARYSVEIQVAKPPLIPQSLIDRVSDELTRVQLPRTLQAFKRRAEAEAR